MNKRNKKSKGIKKAALWVLAAFYTLVHTI